MRIRECFKKTSSARAEISDGPHKGGLRREGPNDFMFVNNLIQRDLSISHIYFHTSKVDFVYVWVCVCVTEHIT